jgi:aminoglycoside/choline kinase family phosphotransferase
LIKGSIWNRDLEKLFRKKFKEEIHDCDVLSSHGSDRIIIRIKSQGKQSAIGIINKNMRENRAFLEFSRHFLEHGINVPETFGISEDSTCYLIEDLGDLTLYDHLKQNHKKGGKTSLNKDLMKLYERSIEELQKFQIEAGKNIDYGFCYQYDEFGEDNIEFDLKNFRERFLKSFYSNHLDISGLERDLNDLKSVLLEVPRTYFLYRDFQSRNIMIKNGELYFIDFQSGRKGALQYDLASLLYDAKADIPQNDRESLMDHYVKNAEQKYNIDITQFKKYFWYFAIIRILQAMGAYGYLGITKGKKKFLESIPYAVRNINNILNEKIGNNSLTYLRQIFSELSELK